MFLRFTSDIKLFPILSRTIPSYQRHGRITPSKLQHPSPDVTNPHVNGKDQEVQSVQWVGAEPDGLFQPTGAREGHPLHTGTA